MSLAGPTIQYDQIHHTIFRDPEALLCFAKTTYQVTSIVPIRSLVIVLVASSCSPKVIVRGYTASSTNVTSVAAVEVIVMTSKECSPIEVARLGAVEVKDGGMSTNCGYDAVVWLAKERASAMGGNLVIITDHTLPDFRSTCHRIKAEVYRVDDPEHYRAEVDWAKDRPLRVKDFQGSIEERPFTAATVSNFYYQRVPPFIGNNFAIEVRVYFIKRLSYFKPEGITSNVLEHEQVHFDMTELYARKFMSRLQNEVMGLADWNDKHDRLYKEVREALYLEQDKYDSEVYADRTKQFLWTAKVRVELESLREFEGVRTLKLSRD